MNDESGIIAIAKRVLNEKEFRVVVLHAINGMKFKDIDALTNQIAKDIEFTKTYFML